MLGSLLIYFRTPVDRNVFGASRQCMEVMNNSMAFLVSVFS